MALGKMASKRRGGASDVSIKLLKKRRTFAFSAIAVFFTLVAILPQFGLFKFVTSLEQSVLDLRYIIRDATIGPAQWEEDPVPIVIVGVDNASLYPALSESDVEKHPEAALLEDAWPWNRSLYALAIQKLIDAGARVVTLDFLFPTPNPGDWDLYEAIEANFGGVVVGYDYVPAENELGQTTIEERLPYDDLLPFEGYEQILGFVNIEKDSDGVLRKAKLTTNIYAENEPFMDDPANREKTAKLAARTEPAFSFAARTALQVDPSIENMLLSFGEHPIINYSGLDYFPRLSFIDLIFEDRFDRQKGVIEDAIVLIGPYSDFFKDTVTTPYGVMNGVETHAHVIRSLVNRAFYQELGRPVFLLMTLLSGLAILIGNLRLKTAFLKTSWTVALILGYLVFSQIGFSSFRTVFPVVPILWVLCGPGAIFIVYDFALAQYERSKLRSYLSRYVSAEVAQVLSSESNDLEFLLKGASRPIAVLFSDIRGFTTLSERYTPVALVAHLNDYFESMVESIHSHRGILNKYIGDAILAVWGGLLRASPEENCINAVRSALDMEQRMIALNREWQNDPDKLPLAIGIGISYGDAFVGNMGHSQRMEFAVMGDVVNLGSRLEGATKQYGCGILVSEEVYELCRHEIRFREIDIIQVKGKTSGIRTFSPINPMDEPPPPWVAQWEAALASYRSRDFEAAKAQFAELETDVTELKQSAGLYRARAEDLIENPPPEDWDFVYIMKTK
jgi:adenylate cyclase